MEREQRVTDSSTVLDRDQISLVVVGGDFVRHVGTLISGTDTVQKHTNFYTCTIFSYMSCELMCKANFRCLTHLPLTKNKSRILNNRPLFKQKHMRPPRTIKSHVRVSS